MSASIESFRRVNMCKKLIVQAPKCVVKYKYEYGLGSITSLYGWYMKAHCWAEYCRSKVNHLHKYINPSDNDNHLTVADCVKVNHLSPIKP